MEQNASKPQGQEIGLPNTNAVRQILERGRLFSLEEIKSLISLMESRAGQMIREGVMAGKNRKEVCVAACGEIGATLEPPMSGEELSAMLFKARGEWMRAGRRRKLAEAAEETVRAGESIQKARTQEYGHILKVEPGLPDLVEASIEDIEEPLEAKKVRLTAHVLAVLKALNVNQKVTLNMLVNGTRPVEAKMLADHIWEQMSDLLKKSRWYKPKAAGTRVTIKRLDSTHILVARHS